MLSYWGFRARFLNQVPTLSILPLAMLCLVTHSSMTRHPEIQPDSVLCGRFGATGSQALSCDWRWGIIIKKTGNSMSIPKP